MLERDGRRREGQGGERDGRAFLPDVPALYYPDVASAGDIVEIGDEEGRHARALRLREGDRALLLDGNGGAILGRVELFDKRHLRIRVEERVLEEPEAGAYIGLVVGTLGDKSRIEWIVEKGVEFGTAEILFLDSERAEGFVHQARLERVALAALKQSQQRRLPAIRGPIAWKDLEEMSSSYDLVLLFHEQARVEDGLLAVLDREPPGNASLRRRVLLLIGPEGGFTEGEVSQAQDRMNARVVSLGPTRLRAETAALAALATVRSAELRNRTSGRVL